MILAEWFLQRKVVREKLRNVLSSLRQTREDIKIHKHTNGKGFRKHVLQALKEIQEFTVKEIGAPDMHTDTKLNTEIKAKGKSNAPYLSVYGCPESYFSVYSSP